MAHSFLKVNPFDVLLQLIQTGVTIDEHFSFWLRRYHDPPIRTTSALIQHCPRVDWLFWYLEQSAKLNHVSPGLVINAGIHVRYHLEAIASGKRYSAKIDGANMPHTEGLAVLRDFLARTLSS